MQLRSPPSQKWACKSQHGFLTEKLSLDNVIEIETGCVVASMDNCNKAAMIFYDFAAACPSVTHALMLRTPHGLGVPRHVAHPLKQLYRNNVHTLRLRRCSMRGLTANTGVKEGCPLSGLFSLSVILSCELCAVHLCRVT